MGTGLSPVMHRAAAGVKTQPICVDAMQVWVAAWQVNCVIRDLPPTLAYRTTDHSLTRAITEH